MINQKWWDSDAVRGLCGVGVKIEAPCGETVTATLHGRPWSRITVRAASEADARRQLNEWFITLWTNLVKTTPRATRMRYHMIRAGYARPVPAVGRIGRPGVRLDAAGRDWARRRIRGLTEAEARRDRENFGVFDWEVSV